MKKEILKSFLTLVCLLTNVLLFAQPGDTDGTPTDNLEGTDPAANIDSMLLLFEVTALLFGFYIVRKIQKGNKSIRII